MRINRQPWFQFPCLEASVILSTTIFQEEKVMIKKLLLILSVVVLGLAACSAAAPNKVSGDMDYGYPGEMPPEAPAEPSRNVTGSGGFGSQVPEARRIVIKDAHMTLVVNQPVDSMDRITTMADRMGGYTVNANVYYRKLESGLEVPQANLTIRVPSERLNEALELIEAESTRPALNKNISSQDVTSQYVDLQSRQRNLEAAEEQLQAIMQDARRTEDVLNVYSQLVQVREQIEVIKGQIQYFDQASALSSISLDLMANEAVQPLSIAGWEPGGVAKTALQSLLNSLQFLANAGIWTVLFLIPLLLMLAAPLIAGILIFKAIIRRNRKAPPAASPSA
jgi:hypothetical protein